MSKNFKIDHNFIKSFYRLIKHHSFSGNYGDLKDKPDSLKNPHKLKFTGSTNDEYDGTEEKTVNIPVYTHPSSSGGGNKSTGLYKISTDENGHVTDVTAVTKEDIVNLGIPGQDTNTVYTHPTSPNGGNKTSNLYKITTDANGHVAATAAVTKDDITGLGIPAQDTTYNVATTSVNGLMSSWDKTKVNELDSTKHRVFSLESGYDLEAMEEEIPGSVFIITQEAANRIDSLASAVGNLSRKLKDEYLQTINDENPAVSQILVTNGTNNYFKKASVNHFKRSIGVGSIEANSVFSGAFWAPSSLSSTSYLKIGTITVGSWVGPMIHLTVGSRGGTYRKAFICFRDGTDGSLDFFKITPSYHSHSASYTSRDGKIYLVKTATTTWDVYIPLSTNGNMGYFGFTVNTSASFTRDLVVASSLPTGYVTPTEVTNLADIP